VKVNRDFTEVTLKLWVSAFQTSSVLMACTDQLLMEYGITTEQYDVLAGAKYLSDRVKISDLATWLRRSPNSVSMLVDRMVKAGLVRRLRDRGDRRLVYVILTSKGQNIVEQSSPGMWEFIKDMLSPLSYEDRRTFLSLF
jgi:DNA-binding MarR family transcriptional regulator